MKLVTWRTTCKMSVNRCFSLVGDSNIRKNINSVNWKDRPLMKSAEVIVCKKLILFSEALKEVRDSSNVVVVSCISNFIADAEDEEGGILTPRNRAEPVILEFRRHLLNFCSAASERQVLVAPPMYRMRPLWYRDGLSELLGLFSELLSDEKPQNLNLLPSFSNPELEVDGIHLTPYSGLQFVLQIFEATANILDRSTLPSDKKSTLADESSRLLLDKVVVLEQDHRRLDKAFEIKTAIDSEYRDFIENQQHEDHLMVSGLPSAPSDLQGREWQDFVKNQLSVVFDTIVGRQCPIVFIQNNTSRARGAETLYQVKMERVEDSKAIRSKFGFFFQGGEDRRPVSLKSVSVRNWVTHETRVRLAIMKVLGQRYKDSNPGSKMKLVSYEPRPSLHLIPPPGARDKKVKRFTFIEAVTRLPTCFSSSEIDTIMKAVGSKFAGKLRSIFVAITDDMRRSRTSSATGEASGNDIEASGSRPFRKRGADVTSSPSRSSKSVRT